MQEFGRFNSYTTFPWSNKKLLPIKYSINSTDIKGLLLDFMAYQQYIIQIKVEKI